MNVKNWCAVIRKCMYFTNDSRIHFYVPTINLKLEYGKDALGKRDMTTFYDTATGEEIITVPSNIAESSTWDEWKKNLKISQHSPVYRIIKAIFDGKLIAAKDPEDAYSVKYDCDCIPGYELY